LTSCATISFSITQLYVATQNVTSRATLVSTVTGLIAAVLFPIRVSAVEHAYFALPVVIKIPDCEANSHRCITTALCCGT
jgi:hypothetical protein